MNRDLALAYGMALVCAAIAVADPAARWKRRRRRARRADVCTCPMSLRVRGEHAAFCAEVRS
jgi:hypothetical protein